MNVTLPNGVVLRDIPDGTPKHQIAMKAIRNGLATNEDFGYDSGMGELGAAGDSKGLRFLEGVGRGMVDVARNVGNFAGIITDEEMSEADDLDRDLLATGMGATGNIVGQIAATAVPLGGAVSKAGAAAGHGLRTARAAGNLSRANAVRGGRLLQSPVARGAVEGAAYGGLLGDHEDRAAGAAGGLLLGAGFGQLGKKLGSAWGNFRLTSMTDEARTVMNETGKFIPLSQSAKPGVIKQFYNAILANIPGVGGKIRNQYDDAVNDLRRWVGEQAVPGYEGVTFGAKDTIHGVIGKLDDFWSTAYDDIGASVLSTRGLRTPAAVTNLLKKETGGMYRIPKPAASAKAQHLLNYKNALNELKGQLSPGQLDKAMRGQIDSALKNIDDVLKKGLDDEVYQGYRALEPYYHNYQILNRAVDKAKSAGQEFTPQQLLTAAAEKGGVGARSGGRPLQQTADSAMRALPDFPSRQGIFQTVAALGLATSVFAGAGVPVAIGAGTAIAVGKLLATKGFQKFISGQHRGKELLSHPQFALFLKTAGYTGRQQVAIKQQILAGEE